MNTNNLLSFYSIGIIGVNNGVINLLNPFTVCTHAFHNIGIYHSVAARRRLYGRSLCFITAVVREPIRRSNTAAHQQNDNHSMPNTAPSTISLFNDA